MTYYYIRTSGPQLECVSIDSDNSAVLGHATPILAWTALREKKLEHILELNQRIAGLSIDVNTADSEIKKFLSQMLK